MDAAALARHDAAMHRLSAPAATEYADFYATYTRLVPDGDVVEHLRRQGEATLALLGALDEARAAYRYAPDKWSIKQLLGHLIDGERLFAYRALSIGRGDPAELPGMDQDQWMSGVDFDARTLASLLAEYRAVRAASLALFETFDEQTGARRGIASGASVTVRALVHIIAGHELHHLGVLRDRYGIG